jgi:chemotaxis protein MotB
VETVAKGKKKGPDKTFWMVTFSDLLSLMLTFFVLLLSMSTMSSQELERISSAFEKGLGVLGHGGPFGLFVEPKEVVIQPSFKAAYRNRMKVLHQNLSSRLAQTGTQAELGTHPEKGEVSLSLPNEALFPSGAAELDARARYVLGQVGEVLRHVNGRVHVVGHSDNVPIAGQGRKQDNWALSLDRAISVAEFFAGEVHLDSNRLSVAGYGPAKPIADNSTEVGREANRRITIKIFTRRTRG